MKSKVWQKAISLLLSVAMICSMSPTIAFAAPVSDGELLHYDKLTGLDYPRPIAEHYTTKGFYESYTAMSPGNEWLYYSFVLRYNEYVNLEVYEYNGPELENGVVWKEESKENPLFTDAMLGNFMGYMNAIQMTDNLTFDPSIGPGQIAATSKKLTLTAIEDMLKAAAKNATANPENSPQQAMKNIFTYAFNGENAPEDWGIVPPGAVLAAPPQPMLPIAPGMSGNVDEIVPPNSETPPDKDAPEIEEPVEGDGAIPGNPEPPVQEPPVQEPPVQETPVQDPAGQNAPRLLWMNYAVFWNCLGADITVGKNTGPASANNVIKPCCAVWWHFTKNIRRWVWTVSIICYDLNSVVRALVSTA